MTESENTVTEQGQPAEIQIPAEFDALVGTKEYAEAVAEFKKGIKDTPVEQKNAENTQDTEENKEEEVKKEVKKEKIKLDNPLLADLEKELNAEEKEKPAEISTVEELFPVLSKESGTEIKDLAGVSKFVSDYKSLKENYETLESNYKKAEIAVKTFEQMPDDLFGPVEIWLNGGDYRAEMSKNINSLVDFSKPFEQQDLKKLISVYVPDLSKDKFSNEEDYSDFKDSAEGKAIIKLVNSKFDDDQSKFVDNRTRFYAKTKKQEELLLNSAQESVAALKKSNTAFDEKQIKNVHKILNDGAQGILSLFMNKDGTFKKDAADKLAKFEYYDDAIAKLKEFVKKRTKTEVVEDVLTRGSKEKTKKTGGSSNVSEKQADEAAAAFVNNLMN